MGQRGGPGLISASRRNPGLKFNTALECKQMIGRGNQEIHFKCTLLIWTKILVQTYPESTTRKGSFFVCSSDYTGKIGLLFMHPMFYLSLKKIDLPYTDSSVYVETYVTEGL